MKISVATKKDFPEIKKIIALYPDKLMQWPLPKVEDFFVAKNHLGKILGVCALEIYSKRIAEVRSLVVLPEFQKQGIGTKLIDCCLKKAKKQKIFEVLSITGAKRVFEKVGFSTFNKEKYAMLKIVS